ncbi:MAG TPA: AAA family ATPase [Chryseosolibacter sp.]|nr:AAA family ATPase [Chryseosolibacter sp.]
MVIIVSGLPGSGKSFFASALSRRLGAEYVGSDQTRRAMDAMGRYKFEDKLNVYEEMAKKVGDHLRKGKTVVIDATFYRHEMRDIFITLAKLLHKQLYYLEVRADEEVIQDRLSRPRVDSEADFAVYQQLKPEYEGHVGDHLVIQSTNDNLEEMLDQALAYIQGVNEGKPN